MAATGPAPICLASEQTVLLQDGVDAVPSQRPEQAQHRALPEQVPEPEANSAGAERQERLAAAAIQRLIDQLQLLVG